MLLITDHYGSLVVSDSPDPECSQVREEVWEECDQVGGGAPGFQVQVLQVRSSV